MCGNFNNKTAVDNSSRQSSVLVDADHPWLGLLSFREQHRRFFFGREREIADLHERARRNRLTVLFGPSGLGKTSILQAGLCPLLRESGALPVLIRLTYPGREMDAVQPPPLITQIAEKIATTLTDTGHELPPLLADPTAITSLWALFHDTVGGLCHAAAPRIVLLIDQFEEIFTLGEDEARAKADAASLRDALADFTENRPPPAIQRQIDIEPELAERFDFDADPCRIVLVLREDYLARLERWRSAMPGLLRNRMEIRLLDGPRAFDAVAGPARLEGRDLVTAAVAADIVRAVAGAAPGTPLDEIAAVPPLLSLLCAKLNELRLKHAAPQISADLLKISIRDILEDFYKGCFAQLPSAAAVRNTIETLLISPSGFRESPSADSVLSALRARGIASPAAALRHLEDERLITSEERGGIRRIEITHDVLAPLAHASRTAAQLRARRRKAILWTILPAFVLAAFCLPLTLWALGEKKRAQSEAQKTREALAESRRQSERAEHEAEVATGMQRIAMQEMELALRSKEEADKALRNALASSLWGRLAVDLQNGHVNSTFDRFLWAMRWGNPDDVRTAFPILTKYNALMGFTNERLNARMKEQGIPEDLKMADFVGVVDSFLQRHPSYTMLELDATGVSKPFLWDDDTKDFMVRMFDAMTDPSPPEVLQRWSHGDKVAFAKYRDLTRCIRQDDMRAMERLVQFPYFWSRDDKVVETTEKSLLGSITVDSFLDTKAFLISYCGDQQSAKPEDALDERSQFAREHLPQAFSSFHWFAWNFAQWALAHPEAPIEQRTKALSTDAILGLHHLNLGTDSHAYQAFPLMFTRAPLYQWDLITWQRENGKLAEAEAALTKLQELYPRDFGIAYALMDVADEKKDAPTAVARAGRLMSDWKIGEIVRVTLAAICAGASKEDWDLKYFRAAAGTCHRLLGTNKRWADELATMISSAERVGLENNPQAAVAVLALARLGGELLSVEQHAYEGHVVSREHFLEAEKRLRAAISSGCISEIKEVSSLTGSMSWFALFAREPIKAIEWARLSLDKRPANMVGVTNLAHGLLFTGKTEEAMKLYETPPGKMEPGEWISVLEDDFKQLREAGYDAHQIDEALNRLKTKWKPPTK